MAHTESVDPRYRDLECWDDLTALEALWEGQLAAVAAVREALPALAAAGAALARGLGRGGRLVYVGAGASGFLAIQDGLELPQTFGWPRDRLVLLLAGGLAVDLQGGAEDEADTARRELAALELDDRDAVIGVTASGTTPYTVAALELARARGALTVGIANNPNTPLLRIAHYPVLLATGAEVIAGSTRMKAGTAQKAALNLLSSLVMTRLGHVYRGRMVDLLIDNDKLCRRGLAMLTDLTGAPQPQAAQALARSNNRVKTAVLVLRGLEPQAADQLLEETGGDLGRALARLD